MDRTKTVIHKILHIDRKVALIGSRLYVIEFEEVKKQADLLHPLYLDYDFQSNTLIVVTRRDIRFYSMLTGRLSYTINNLTQEQD